MYSYVLCTPLSIGTLTGNVEQRKEHGLIRYLGTYQVAVFTTYRKVGGC